MNPSILANLDTNLQTLAGLVSLPSTGSSLSSIHSQSEASLMITSTIPCKRKDRQRCAWTPEEDNLLRLAVQLYGDKTEKWAKIAACVPGRTNKNCRKRWFHSLDPSLRKGAWTPEEDELLRQGVERYQGQWSKIAEAIPGRTDDQCAKRWRESLDPAIDRAEWSPEEDGLLLEKYEELGSQWQKISQFFPGRPGLHCRNRWRKIQRSMNQKSREKEKLTQALMAPVESKLTQDILNTSQSMVTADFVAISHSDSLLPTEFQFGEHEGKAYGCGVDNCLASFLDSSGLFYHMKVSHPRIDPALRPYRCGLLGCNKKYKNINGLTYHIKHAKNTSGHGNSGMHGGLDQIEKPYKCPHEGCDKSYRNPNGLQYHQTHAHGPEEEEMEKPFICSVEGCDKSYMNPNGLAYHFRHGHPELLDSSYYVVSDEASLSTEHESVHHSIESEHTIHQTLEQLRHHPGLQEEEEQLSPLR
ncbi:hypothetical protein K493DRAFT_30240 [Basidiobolus meristosporus CBS 931.73]|uniref:Homeodomain-like protein n=1 Tax=Basidiobolus meristosporus CBS 931.73 TaxID=1314790 RepID=A0A1Y1Y933_9FUNG|nr:hypothetical protein K493DRAFT_30240 [Basidiobolus meristosporus CBS 931.73]|eukprot:ORX94530.1 hypothetical protein K493DRAFT_30240 [Basidiobolus meristosporus CBS 931.73]